MIKVTSNLILSDSRLIRIIIKSKEVNSIFSKDASEEAMFVLVFFFFFFFGES